MKTKEEIIAVIEKIKSLNIALSVADYEAVLHYLKLSTLNRMRIDEERFYKIWNKKDISEIEDILSEYNSTCKDHQVLQPLPSEIPKELRDKYIKDDSYFLKDMWQELIKHYGTPTKKELVSVEELEKEIRIAYNKVDSSWKSIAQHIIDTYSLNPAKREWWMDCEKFVYKGRVYKKYSYEIFPDGHTVLHAELSRHDLKDCTPYIEPSIHDKFMASLSDEQKKLYDEMKEVKGGM